MNNSHFAMVRYLRDQGIDADLLLTDREDEHFHPKADTFDLKYMTYTRYLSWGSSRRLLFTTADQIRNDLAPYQILIGSGLAPAYCLKAGRILDIFVPYGGDIWIETFYWRMISPQRIPSAWYSVYCQRRAIGKSKIVHMTKTNTLYEQQYHKYRGLSDRWYEGVPAVYAPEYKSDKMAEMVSRTHWGHELLRIRSNADLMVVSHMRHVWSDESDPSAKGNDILLRGWKLFCTRNRGIKAKLILTEYGRDVAKSRSFVQQLQLEDSVVWFPQMYRKDIMVGLHLADIVCGEFVNSWIVSGVLYEALVAGKPILAWRNDDLYLQDYPNLYPILKAGDPESIAARLEEYIQNPELGRQMGRIGHQWYEEEVERKALDRYIEYIERRAS